MVRKKHKCDECGDLYFARGLVKVKGHGRLCYKCRLGLPEYRISNQIPHKETLATFFGLKTKKIRSFTK